MTARQPGVYLAEIHGFTTAFISQSDKFFRHATLGTVHAEADLTDIRPAIVLDPKNEIVLEFLDAFEGQAHLANRLAAKIREQMPKPERIKEPGLWSVVAATSRNGSNDKWVRTSNGPYPWVSATWHYQASWDDLRDPVLIRPGVGDE